MTTKEEKKWRREINQGLRQKERAEAESGMPITKPTLRKLFDYLDHCLLEDGCDHTLRITQAFIRDNGLSEEIILDWLEKYGGYCDCEVLANVEDAWSEPIDQRRNTHQ